MSEVYAVIWSVPYEGENLMGVFSDYVKARRYVLYQKDENLEIRKLELNKVYEDMFIVGETV